MHRCQQKEPKATCEGTTDVMDFSLEEALLCIMDCCFGRNLV